MTPECDRCHDTATRGLSERGAVYCERHGAGMPALPVLPGERSDTGLGANTTTTQRVQTAEPDAPAREAA